MQKIVIERFNELNIDWKHKKYIINYSIKKEYGKDKKNVKDFFVINSIYNSVKKRNINLEYLYNNHKKLYDNIKTKMSIFFNYFKMFWFIKNIAKKIVLYFISFYIMITVLFFVFDFNVLDIKYKLFGCDLKHYTIVEKWSTRYKHNWRDIYALIMTESEDEPKAVSKDKITGKEIARGLGQLTKLVENLGRDIFKKELKNTDVFNPEFNVAVTCLHLRSLLDNLDGDIYKAIECYNLGFENYVKKTKTAKEYVSKFMMWRSYFYERY